MKVENTNKRKIGNYDVYERETMKGWAIVIMPSGIKIDNFHGFSHFHFSQEDKKHHKITINTKEEAYYIVFNHIIKNEKLNPKKLFEELL
jgi:hypothetical protein